MLNREWINVFKRILKVAIDAAACAISLTIAYKLRLEHNLSEPTIDWFWAHQLPIVLGIVILIRISSFFVFQIYTRMWRYTEVSELLELSKPIFLSSVVMALPRIIGLSAKTNLLTVPIGVIIIDSALCMIFLSTIRLLRKWQVQNRTIKKRRKSNSIKTKKRTLLIGAGVAAQELTRKVLQHPELDIEIIGALDDDTRKHNTKIIKNIKVFGPVKALEKVVQDHNIEEIIITIPSLPPVKLREIIELCQKTKLETHTIPGADQLAGGKVTVEQIRKVSLEDLLGRESVDLSIPEVANFINNKTILITGAGGSIGSEITRQIVKHFTPKHIYILGRGENSIFQLSQELISLKKFNFTPIICDIRNHKLLSEHLMKIAPEVVFHAAAHKHVPLMEDHPKEAFENNTIGTKNIAEIAGKLNVKTFVNISTDKAVNPVNVLGCTKRLAELIVISCAKQYSGTKYVSVRFGNVIGSRGSVIPTWEFQLKNRMPLTVTDKETYRYFMTLSESSGLVIKSSAIGNSSDIMVLDMGEEVNIYKLAEDFIKLSGFDPNEVKINISGLRPGEKLKEELVGYYEGANTTKHKKILIIESKRLPDGSLKSTLEELSSLSENSSLESFRNKLIETTKKLNDSQLIIPLIALTTYS